MNKQISCKNIFILKKSQGNGNLKCKPCSNWHWQRKKKRERQSGREGEKEREKEGKEGTSDRGKPPAFHIQQGLGKQQTSYLRMT